MQKKNDDFTALELKITKDSFNYKTQKGKKIFSNHGTIWL